MTYDRAAMLSKKLLKSRIICRDEDVAVHWTG